MTKKTVFLTNVQENLANKIISLDKISGYPLIEVESSFWSETAIVFSDLKARFVAIWARDNIKNISVIAAYENNGNYFFVHTYLDNNDLQLESITPIFAGADRMERHTSDLFGIKFTNHPNKQRWIRHAAWNENEFPLRKNFIFSDKKSEVTPADTKYPFKKINGNGVFEIPVGPIHAGIIEPGHFRFHAAGEDVIMLEEHLGYVHKGIEKIAEGKTFAELIRLSNRISGDSVIAYSWCTTKALEQIAQIEIPERALYLRAIMCERERIMNHLWDIAATGNDVGFSFAYFQLGRLREIFLRNNFKYFGHRFMKDTICLGGVNKDIDAVLIQQMFEELKLLRKELDELYPIMESNSSVHDRLKTTGVLTFDKASKLGVLGYVARASGHKYDVRANSICPPYNKFKITVPVLNTGDVLARTNIRASEITNSIQLLQELLTDIPSGEINANLANNQIATKEGVAIIEGWRGEIFVYIKVNQEGIIDRFFLRDPSWFSWLALEQLIHGNIVPDFPVCNKSINGTYAGVDL